MAVDRSASGWKGKGNGERARYEAEAAASTSEHDRSNGDSIFDPPGRGTTVAECPHVHHPPSLTSARRNLHRITVGFDPQPLRHLLRTRINHRRNHNQPVGLALVPPLIEAGLPFEDIHCCLVD